MFRERTIDAHRSSTEKCRRDKHTTDLPIVPSISVCVAIDRPAARNCGTFFCLFSLLFFLATNWRRLKVLTPLINLTKHVSKND